MPDEKQTVAQFIEAINAHDVELLLGLMTDDHRLIDGGGQVVSGGEAVREAWRTYFDWMPDYRIEADEMLSGGEAVGVFGTARGTYAPNGVIHAKNQWGVPATWRAVVRGGRVAEWQVYADTTRVGEIMERCRPE